MRAPQDDPLGARSNVAAPGPRRHPKVCRQAALPLSRESGSGRGSPRNPLSPLVPRGNSEERYRLLPQYASVEQIAERIGWFGEGNVAVARQVYVAHSRAEAEEALARQAALTRRIIDVSRSPDSQRGSHVLGYADTQEHALFGTPDEICAGLQALSEGGVGYVLLQLAADPQQLRRIAQEVIASDGASV